MKRYFRPKRSIQRLQYNQYKRDALPVSSEVLKNIEEPIRTNYFSFTTPALGLCIFPEHTAAYSQLVDACVVEGLDIALVTPQGGISFVMTVAEAVRMSAKGHGTGIIKRRLANEKRDSNPTL